MPDFATYLRSISAAYEKWWEYYTLTDAESRAEIRPETFDFGWVETVRSAERDDRAESREKIERLPVLAGLRKYAAGHVLLVGRPGSGKSTALARLVLEEAALTLNPSPNNFGRGTLNLTGLGDEGPIPVLVELRYWQGSIVELIQRFFGRHGLQVDRAGVEQLLFDRRLLLCVDGLNELPSEAGRQDVARLRRYFPQVAMVFTTRDLSLGGDFGVEKKLEMQALTEPQMREFVRSYLPNQGEAMLRQLGDRLREFGQTPLLLWMLCGLFRQSGEIPTNLGGVFRAFTQGYERNLKGDVVPEGDRRWWAELLQALAGAMMRGAGGAAVEFRVAIGKAEVCSIFAEFLRDKEAQPAGAARKCLEDLLKHHLIQASGEQVEFRHQLIQEYYAAEWLLERVGGLGDGELKREFLNFLKWTEPVALMLALVEGEALAVRVVRLGLKVDLMLGARLAGEVKPQFQAQTVGFVDALEVPDWLKIELLGQTRSESASLILLELVENSDSYYFLKWRTAEALGRIGSVVAIPSLLRLGKNAGRDRNGSYVRTRTAKALGEIGSVEAVQGLLELVESVELEVSVTAAEALCKIGSVEAVQGLLKRLEDADSYVCGEVAKALGKIGSVEVVSDLLKRRLLERLEDDDSYKCGRAAGALGEIGSVEAVQGLLKLMEDGGNSADVRASAAKALGKIGSVEAVQGLLKLMEEEDNYLRRSAAEALGEIGSVAAIPGLLKLAGDAHSYGRLMEAVGALGEIGYVEMIPWLLRLVKHDEPYLRQDAANVLGKIGRVEAIPGLLKLVKDEDPSVRVTAAEALCKIGSSFGVIPDLLKLTEHNDSAVRWRAAEALGKIRRVEAIPGLLKLTEDVDSAAVRGSAAEALGKIGSVKALPGLLKLMEDTDPNVHPNVHYRAAAALGEIGTIAPDEITPHLPHLLTLIPTKSGAKVHRAILTIQAACKFYNYEIWQDYLTAQKTDPASQSRDRSPTIQQNFYGTTYGVAGNVEGNQITPPANSVD